MGWVVMSERELNRVEVLAQVDDGRLSVDNAANMPDLARRQIFRLLKRYRQYVDIYEMPAGWTHPCAFQRRRLALQQLRSAPAARYTRPNYREQASRRGSGAHQGVAAQGQTCQRKERLQEDLPPPARTTVDGRPLRTTTQGTC